MSERVEFSMSGLPDYTVAATPQNGLVVVKVNGAWYDYEEGEETFLDSDDELFAAHPDAVVVALPTARPLTREQARKLVEIRQAVAPFAFSNPADQRFETPDV